MKIERLPGHFGVRIPGVHAPSLSEQALRTIFDLLLEHRFLVLPGQALDHDAYSAFGRQWGRPVLLIASRNRVETHPEIIRQTNSAATPEYARNIANHWHCDSSYEEEVATTTMLYGVEAPEHGGETLFSDLVAAYRALPETRQRELERLQVRHATSAATPMPDERISRPQDLPDAIRQTVRVLDPVLHPLVQRHPATGRKALYGLGGSASAIEGLPEGEGQALLLELRAYAAEPRFCASYKLLPGDLLLWDNFSVMHRATPIAYSDEPNERRSNYRISLKGLPTFVGSV